MHDYFGPDLDPYETAPEVEDAEYAKYFPKET